MSYSLSLRSWRRFSVGLLLSFLLIERILSLLLLEPAPLPVRILIASDRFGSRRVALVLARCICLLSCFAVPLIFPPELLIPDFLRNWFHAHRFRQILPERRRKRRGTDHHRRVVKLLGNARRQINFAPAPRGMEYGVP
jgi:hypothetical protein